jgi:hypothetical protein
MPCVFGLYCFRKACLVQVWSRLRLCGSDAYAKDRCSCTANNTWKLSNFLHLLLLLVPFFLTVFMRFS